MKFQTMRELYIAELRDLYSAEQQMLKEFPRMVNSTTSEPLRKAFEVHIDETRLHVERLDLIFGGLGESSAGHHCRAMEGILAEAEEVFLGDMPDAIKDAALIAAAQRIEHHEMAGYGCARTYAKLLGEMEAFLLLNESLQDEGDVDKWLTEIAENSVNRDATSVAVSV